MALTRLSVADADACVGYIVVEVGLSQWASHLHLINCRSHNAQGYSSFYY
jgi:hypothetical protein